MRSRFARPGLSLCGIVLLAAGCAKSPAALQTQGVPPAVGPAWPATALPSVTVVASEETDGAAETEVAPLAPEAVGREPRAYVGAQRTDAAGQTVTSSSWDDPVYLTPRHFPLILPGSPAAMPAFTPHAIDLSRLPTDAFVELSRLGRLREAKRARLHWLFGDTFPKIEAAVAKSRLVDNQPIFLAPNGSPFHFDRTYIQINDTTTIEAMLPELRQKTMDKEARDLRDTNIRGRMQVLPPFNGTYDIVKLLLLALIVDDYTFGGQPVRRGLVAAANLYEMDGVRRAIATYWEDHPGLNVSELRQASNRALGDKFHDMAFRASYLASEPAWYTDAQAVPGLRDPRPIRDGDSTAHDLDVRYNRLVFQELGLTMPLILSSTVYP